MGFVRESADAKKNALNQKQPKFVAEIREIQQSLLEHFVELKDPRVERTKKTFTQAIHLDSSDSLCQA
ncbi:hypothetical protein WA1_37625 [Scytonema hofmannii PCC 7110]|uniref:Uncharacterized protein n=1 Tax=Scytonema hofmannii PCC 7110 TaxID=128403 RepID=A0A139X043_9CYAN|nr:hypothetical protein [Scytonema hofmannii]KYC38075.1 hypothetical protein WA1_37625 [Scytonema hofmannii PCC 7110]